MERLTSKRSWEEAGKELGQEYGYSHIGNWWKQTRRDEFCRKQAGVRKCPKCGKMNMYPRIDWKYFYCYSCETTFPAEEIIRPKAALAKEADHE